MKSESGAEEASSDGCRFGGASLGCQSAFQPSSSFCAASWLLLGSCKRVQSQPNVHGRQHGVGVYWFSAIQQVGAGWVETVIPARSACVVSAHGCWWPPLSKGIADAQHDQQHGRQRFVASGNTWSADDEVLVEPEADTAHHLACIHRIATGFPHWIREVEVHRSIAPTG